MDNTVSAPTRPLASFPEIFLVFLKLGLTSFGGPIAHLGYFRHEFVEKRRWLSEHAYVDLVALCQFLPGPASSEVGMALGLSRGGLPGAFAAWLGFTLPTALVLTLFALGYARLAAFAGGDWLHGLMLAAVAVVAQAIWSMGRSLCPDLPRAGIALCAAVLAYLVPGTAGQVGVIAGGGVLGWLLFRSPHPLPAQSLAVPIGRRTGGVLLALFFILLLGMPALSATGGGHALALFDGFYRAGALVFGGGHVVLPLLQTTAVSTGWVYPGSFLAGYGAAQAMPGPLFAVAAYLGAASTRAPAGWLGAAIALAAIFLPGFLLVTGVLPFWDTLRENPSMRRAMPGVNAAVVGLLLAAFYRPVASTAILGPADFLLALTAFVLLTFGRWPPWLLVMLCALAAGLLRA